MTDAMGYLNSLYVLAGDFSFANSSGTCLLEPTISLFGKVDARKAIFFLSQLQLSRQSQ